LIKKSNLGQFTLKIVCLDNFFCFLIKRNFVITVSSLKYISDLGDNILVLGRIDPNDQLVLDHNVNIYDFLIRFVIRLVDDRSQLNDLYEGFHGLFVLLFDDFALTELVLGDKLLLLLLLRLR